MTPHRMSRVPALAMFLALAAFGAGARAEVTYVYSDVGTRTGSNDFTTGTGSNSGQVVTTNLPFALTNWSANYQFGSGPTTGTWRAQIDADNVLEGTFTNGYSGTAGPFNHFADYSVITGGTGVFSGATGSGTWQSFVIETSLTPDGSTYDQVTANRMTLTLPSGPAQTDLRPLGLRWSSVLFDSNANTGIVTGNYIFPEPLLPGLPPLKASVTNFACGPNSCFGRMTDTDFLGNTTNGAYEDSFLAFIDGWSVYGGGSTADENTGAYAPYRITSEYVAFQKGYPSPPGAQPNFFNQYNVLATRADIAPIPEPETSVLFAVGILGVGLAIRRARRMSA